MFFVTKDEIDRDEKTFFSMDKKTLGQLLAT